MRARDRWRRSYGYARANARWEQAWRALGPEPRDPVKAATLSNLYRHECIAFERLSEKMRRALVRP